MKMTIYKHRLVARISLEAVSPLAVGSGEKDIITDTPVARDCNGLPYIPGTSLMGIIRHSMSQENIKQLLGYQDKEKGEGSKVIISDALLTDENGKALDGLQDWDNNEYLRHFQVLPVRQHVKITEKGTAAKTGKFDEQVVYAGTRFVFEIEELSVDGTDTRFMEMTLFNEGYAIFFKDEAMDEFLCLQARIGGQLNVYRVPKIRTAYAVNGYQYELNEKNSVIIYNNYLRYPSVPDAQFFAAKLVNIDRAIDVNVNAQKTPILIRTTPDQQLGLENAYMKWQGNQPVIYANKASDLGQAFDVLTTNAPLVFKDLYELKTQVWNEALTRMGISSVNTVKKERMITDEVARAQGGTIASRYSRLEMRKQACEQINAMFGLNISVEYRDDFLNMVDNGEEESVDDVERTGSIEE